VKDTILIVDDNPRRLTGLSALIEGQGYAVLTALDGHQALRLLSLSEVDLVVLDYYMPNMSGGEVALEMRRLHPDVPIVIYSAALSLPELVISMVDGFISATGEPERLLEKIDEVLGQRQVAKAS